MYIAGSSTSTRRSSFSPRRPSARGQTIAHQKSKTCLYLVVEHMCTSNYICIYVHIYIYTYMYTSISLSLCIYIYIEIYRYRYRSPRRSSWILMSV